MSDDNLLVLADAYEWFEMEQAGQPGLRDELFSTWCQAGKLATDDREAIRLVLLGRGVKVGRAA